MRPTAAALSLSLIILLACVASEQKDNTPPPIRVDTAATTAPAIATDTAAPFAPESMQPNIHPAMSDEDFDRARREAFSAPVAAVATDTQPRTRTVKTQPLRAAPRHTVMFAAPGLPLPLPILDHRKRGCIGIPLVASPRTKRMNLALGANIYEFEGMHKSWIDPAWREFHRIAPDGSFGVNLWRVRRGIASFVDTLRVPGGPKPSFVQFPLEQLYPGVWRGGDVACLEAIPHGGPLLIYDHQSWISVIETSGDPGKAGGAWTTVSRFNYGARLDAAPDGSRLVAGDEVWHCPEMEAPPAPAPGGQFQRVPETWTVWNPLVGGQKPIGSCRLVKTISKPESTQ